MKPSSCLFTENTFGDVRKTLVRSGAGSTSDKIGFLPFKGLTIFCQDTQSKFKYFLPNSFTFYLIKDLLLFLFMCL